MAQVMFVRGIIFSTSNILHLSNLNTVIDITATDNDNMPRHIVAVGDLELSLDGYNWTEKTLEVDFTNESMQKILVRPAIGLESGSGTISVEEI